MYDVERIYGSIMQKAPHPNGSAGSQHSFWNSGTNSSLRQTALNYQARNLKSLPDVFKMDIAMLYGAMTQPGPDRTWQCAIAIF